MTEAQLDDGPYLDDRYLAPGEPAAQVYAAASKAHNLYGDAGSLLADLRKAAVPNRPRSRRGDFLGRRERLFDFDAIAALREFNVHHSACLDAKIRATVGLGHRDQDVTEALDPLCAVSWRATLQAVVSDCFEFGNGYLEVVRHAEDGSIAGLYHIPARDVWVFVETDDSTFHYEIRSTEAGEVVPGEPGIRFARFGDREDFLRRHRVSRSAARRVAEVIPVYTTPPGRASRHYGEPDWIAAVPAMELDQCVTQSAFDFFFNGGQPSTIFEVAGARLDPDDWEALRTTLQQHQGLGRRHRMLAVNIHGDTALKVHRLSDGTQPVADAGLVDQLALKIVSAHRVPALLAGIQIPGKLGASNEQISAIRAFQALVIETAQVHVSAQLARTLGDPDDGVEGLVADDFLGGPDDGGNGFVRITDRLDLDRAATEAQMRMTPEEAAARGRDLSAGLATRGSDIAAHRGRDPNEPVDR